MAVHRGPASLRPRCTRGGSPVAAMPIYHLIQKDAEKILKYKDLTIEIQRM
jgi:hypothetical protein